MAGILTVIGIIVFGSMSRVKGSAIGHYDYNPMTLLMFIPVIMTIIIAIKTGDIIIIYRDNIEPK